MSDENKKIFNPTLSRGYAMRRGFWSPPLSSEEYDSIMKHIEIGGRLVFKTNAVKKNDKSPDGYFEFVPAATVKEMAEQRRAQSDGPSDGI